MKRGLVQNSALALAGDLATKGGALVLVVVCARVLPVAEFAVLATALAAATLATSTLDCGAQTLLAREGATSAADRGSLLVALARARLPLAAALLVLAGATGLLLGRPLEALATALLAIVSAATLSVLGAYRAAQDLRPEALQRLAGALLALAAAIGCALVLPRVAPLLLALTLAALAALLPLLPHVRRVARLTNTRRAWPTLRRALPLGAIALATIAYTRAGTIAVAGLAGPVETASFAVASTVAFGLLAVPNAITTGLLPRLAAEPDPAARAACARRTLGVTLALTLPLCLAAALAGPAALRLAFGPAYESAHAPLAVLALGVCLIAASGVLGTALLAAGRTRTLVAQVAASLAVNAIALAVLVPRFGAMGAAFATVACELAGLALLLAACRRHLPDLLPPFRRTALTRPAIRQPA